MSATNVKITETENWAEFDRVDLHPEAGAFVSSTWSDFQIEGETLRALNYVHAQYIWLKTQIQATGQEFGVCAHCHHAIRWAVIYRDEVTGQFFAVGNDCSTKIRTKPASKGEWSVLRLAKDVKQIKTKNGERCVLSLPVPAWYCNIAREDRPKFTSVSKYSDRRGKPVWSLTIWGESTGEVLENYRTFVTLQGQALSGEALEAEKATRAAAAAEAKKALGVGSKVQFSGEVIGYNLETGPFGAVRHYEIQGEDGTSYYYKGSAYFGGSGAKFTMKATVKDVRNGVTVIQRPILGG